VRIREIAPTDFVGRTSGGVKRMTPNYYARATRSPDTRSPRGFSDNPRRPRQGYRVVAERGLPSGDKDLLFGDTGAAQHRGRGGEGPSGTASSAHQQSTSSRRKAIWLRCLLRTYYGLFDLYRSAA
jgi:hypothetical protein